MKSLRLPMLVMVALMATVSASFACPSSKTATTADAKGASVAPAVASKGSVPAVPASGGCSAEAIRVKGASASGHGCSAEMAAQCTPAMREACAKNPKVAAAMGCDPSGKGTTVTAAAQGSKGSGVKVAAASSGDHCGMKGASAKGATAGGKECSAHANAAAHDCSPCADWVGCEKDVRALKAKSQVVALKNGVMVVYTADRAADVRSLQSAVAKRHERMAAALSSTDTKKLCDDCRTMRGAMASGRLTREIVNVESGCMTLITSEDKSIVRMIRTMTGQPVAMR
ncbi:MAG: hypothetical protein ACKO3S_06015 [bacterium]